MTIYFKSDKQAFAYQIPDAVATVDDETWRVYCYWPAGTAWDVIGGAFVQLRTIADVQASLEAERQIRDLKQKLGETDYQAIKYAEGRLSDEEYAASSAQREAWRVQIRELEGKVISQQG